MSLKIEDAGYRIIEPLASGGMGQVFKAEHVITKRIEAVKILAGAGTEEETERFLREIQLQASLSHPNIAAVYNAFRFEDVLVMVMELVEGEPLRAMLQRGRLAPNLAVRYASEVLNAIGYAHEHGVIHRDIKPSNIVITPQGSIKLMDFGLAKAATSPSASQSGVYMGSPHYMSPEQVKDATRASERSDIYSLGAVLYEMVTGRQVFEGDSSFMVMQAQVEAAPLPPNLINPAISASLNAAILTALEKDPARRFASAEAFRRALQAPTQAVTRVAPANRKWSPRWLMPALQFGVTCAVILLPTAFYVHSRRHPVDLRKSDKPTVMQIAPSDPPVEAATPAARPSPALPPTERSFSRPSPKRTARRTPPPSLTPTVTGLEPPRTPAPVRRPEPAHPEAAVSPAAAPRLVPEPPPPTVAAPEIQTAEALHADPAAPVTEKKPRGRVRRALGKILSAFH